MASVAFSRLPTIGQSVAPKISIRANFEDDAVAGAKISALIRA
jgi:hypothetical protein